MRSIWRIKWSSARDFFSNQRFRVFYRASIWSSGHSCYMIPFKYLWFATYRIKTNVFIYYTFQMAFETYPFVDLSAFLSQIFHFNKWTFPLHFSNVSLGMRLCSKIDVVLSCLYYYIYVFLFVEVLLLQFLTALSFFTFLLTSFFFFLLLFLLIFFFFIFLVLKLLYLNTTIIKLFIIQSFSQLLSCSWISFSYTMYNILF